MQGFKVIVSKINPSPTIDLIASPHLKKSADMSTPNTPYKHTYILPNYPTPPTLQLSKEENMTHK